MDAEALTDYAGVVGQLLAKGHARTSGASMIAAGLLVTYLVSTVLQERADLKNDRAATRQADEPKPPLD